jgi:arginyl-tRNA synthetase
MQLEKNLFDALKVITSELLIQAIETIEDYQKLPQESKLDKAQVYGFLVEPPQKEFGDLAFGVFALAKTLKKAPPQIAALINEKLLALPNYAKDFAKITALGPYLNFKYTHETLGKYILNPILTGEYFQRKLYSQAPKSMVEFSQPNTHKELHVGHMRNMCLGDAVVKLMKASGMPVITSTFPGDVGTHVAKCLWYLKFHSAEAGPEPETQKGEWIGRIYSKAHNKLEDEVGTDKEAHNREQLTEILKQLEQKQGEYFERWKVTRQWSVDLMKDVYKWAGVGFDYWYWESEVDSDSVKLVKKYKQEGKLIESQGAVGLDFSEEGLGFCMLLKSDGTGLYATKDIELARRKFQEHQIEKSIYVVDVRQALHFKQVFKALEVLGFKQAKDCHHLQYNFVELPDGAMSSRKGNIVPLIKLINEMEAKIIRDYLNRYTDEWSQEEIKSTAHIVAQGAIKYGMLRQDPAKKIVFDMNEWLKLDGESGPFIQYSFARINSLVSKLSQEVFGYSVDLKKYDHDIFNRTLIKLNTTGSPIEKGSLSDWIDWNQLKEKAEIELAQFLMYYHHQLMLSVENYKPSTMCTYVYDLAKRFNFFYHECPIGNEPNLELKKARLALAMCTGLVLEKGLEVLGIPVPKRM